MKGIKWILIVLIITSITAYAMGQDTAVASATASHVKVEINNITSEAVTRDVEGRPSQGTKYEFDMVITELAGIPTYLLRYDFNVTNNAGQLFPSSKSYSEPKLLNAFQVGKTRGTYTFWGELEEERSGSAEIVFACRDADGTEFDASSGQVPLDIVVYVLVDINQRSVQMKTEKITLKNSLTNTKKAIANTGYNDRVIAESFNEANLDMIWVLTPFRIVDFSYPDKPSPLQSGDSVDKMLEIYPDCVQYASGGSNYYIDWKTITIFVTKDGKLTGIGMR